jgi:hypothetical protein
VYKNEFPKAVIHKVEGAGHYVFIDKALTTARLIGECLE